jgi:hypothetical protein
MALTMPMIRTGKANSLGTLTRSSAVPHRVIPAANDRMPLSGSAAALESTTPSPIANTRKPPATTSFPVRKHFIVSSTVAITSPAPSDRPQNRLQRWRDHRPGDAKHSTKRKTDCSNDFERIAHPKLTCFRFSGPRIAGKFQFSGTSDSGRWARNGHEAIEVHGGADSLHPAAG